MPTVSENLSTVIAGYAAALAADALNPQPNYDLDGKKVDRVTWRADLLRRITEAQKTVNALNPYCVVTRKAL